MDIKAEANIKVTLELSQDEYDGFICLIKNARIAYEAGREMDLGEKAVDVLYKLEDQIDKPF